MSSLANNYRPLTFSNLIGQDVMVKIITNAITLNKVADTFLLTGPHGTGKTSTARIIAKSLNCTQKKSIEPCMNCFSCTDITKSIHTDVLEMDAASNTSVDNIRTILENAKYLPAQAKFKVYIIDEVHMLSNSAFNALLKTLEEPYDHVKFILATTELNKVPATIISRCQRFNLNRISDEQLADYLLYISKKENVYLSEDAAMIISKSAKGSVRDGISILEQLILYSGRKNISIQDVRNVLSVSDESRIILLLKYISEQNSRELLKSFHNLYINGSDPILVLHEILEMFHNVSRVKTFSNQKYSKDLIDLSKRYSMELLNRLWQALLTGIQNVKIAPNMYSASEIILLRLCYLASLPPPSEMIKRITGKTIGSPQLTEETFLELCKQNGELILHEYLNSKLQIIDINNNSNVIKLELIYPINSLNKLSEKIINLLYSFTNKQWKVEIIDKTIDFPIVNRVMQKFQNAKIVDVKKV